MELDRILDRIGRGTWEPPATRPPPTDELDLNEDLRTTAYRWWQRRKGELAPSTRLDYRWRLDHLIRRLGDARTAQLDARRVDALR